MCDCARPEAGLCGWLCRIRAEIQSPGVSIVTSGRATGWRVVADLETELR